MIWLLLLALAAWITYRAAALTNFENSPRVAWWSVVVAGTTLFVVAARFALMEQGVDFMDEYLPMKDVGLGTLFIPVINLFIALGPIGNAVFWGFLGALLLRKAWDGGWHRGALTLRQIAEEDAEIRERNEQRSRIAREYWGAQRRSCFERTGATLGRWVGRLVRGRRA